MILMTALLTAALDQSSASGESEASVAGAFEGAKFIVLLRLACATLGGRRQYRVSVCSHTLSTLVGKCREDRLA